MRDLSVKPVKVTARKTTYGAFLKTKALNFTAKEEYSGGTIKWYPFYVSEQKAIPKYQNIQFVATRNKKVPKYGFSTNPSRGYGFTSSQGVNAFFRYIDRTKPKIKAIVFVEGKTKIANSVLELNFKDFAKIRASTKSLTSSKRSEEEYLIKNLLFGLLPGTYKKPTKYIYNPGSIDRLLRKFADSPFSLSDDDVESIRKAMVGADLPPEVVVSTKRDIDRVYIEDVLQEYKQLYSLKTATKNLEDKWHRFFKKHTWIFSQVLAYPVVFLKDKVNVGGQDLSGSPDKIVDFLYKNKLTNNVTFIEIKTHLTPLVHSTPYRKPDIYSVSKHLTGSIVQVLDQKTKFLKNFHTKKGTSKVDSLNSTCLVVVGDFKSIKKKHQKDSFEVFRLSNKDVTVVTFDELLLKIETMLSIFDKSA